jgi:uncharacterized protein
VVPRGVLARGYVHRVPGWVEFLLTVLVGVGTGILSGMFGIGGAVVSTPALRLLGVPPLEAVGSTLPSILPSSISGSYRYNREGLINRRVFLVTAAFGVGSSVLGSLLSREVPGDGHLLMLLTAALVAYTAWRTAFPSQRTVELGEAGIRTDWWRCAVIGLAAGLLSGLLGIGGGILMVPAFAAWLGLPLKETIATSLACVGVLAIPGTLTHWALGEVDWFFAIALTIGVIPGAQVGAHFTINTSDRRLRLTVGGMLAAIAMVYAIGELIAMID